MQANQPTYPSAPISRNRHIRYAGGCRAASATSRVSVEATKFLTYVRTVNATLNDPINSSINAYTLKNLIQGTGNVSTAVFTGSTPIITAPAP
jgi:hypothetical protein